MQGGKSTPYIIQSYWPCLYQKLSKLAEIWQSYDENNSDCFFLRQDVYVRIGASGLEIGFDL